MSKDFRVLLVCCFSLMAALLVVGAVSHGVIRHIVQTSPLWIGVGLGLRRSSLTKWAVLPCFIFWLLIMTAIWLFLLGWARMITGTFSPTEVAMTLIVGLASLVGIISAARTRSASGAASAAALTVLVAVLQVLALRLSLLPQIAHR